MNRDFLLEQLHNGVCEVTFTKVNGETRVMKCTLHSAYLPPQLPHEEGKAAREPNSEVIAVWDLNANDWRSFRTESVTDTRMLLTE